MIGWLKKTWGLNTDITESRPTESRPTESRRTELSSRSQNISSRTLDSISIEGDSQFVNHVSLCIEELRNTEYESSVAGIQRIIQVANYADTGVAKREFKATSYVMGCTAWIKDHIVGASMLIHEAVHTEREFSGEFDYSNYANEELLAFQPQIEFLRSNGRHSYAVQLENQDGRHNEAGMTAEQLARQR